MVQYVMVLMDNGLDGWVNDGLICSSVHVDPAYCES